MSSRIDEDAHDFGEHPRLAEIALMKAVMSKEFRNENEWANTVLAATIVNYERGPNPAPMSEKIEMCERLLLWRKVIVSLGPEDANRFIRMLDENPTGSIADLPHIALISLFWSHPEVSKAYGLGVHQIDLIEDNEVWICYMIKKPRFLQLGLETGDLIPASSAMGFYQIGFKSSTYAYSVKFTDEILTCHASPKSQWNAPSDQLEPVLLVEGWRKESTFDELIDIIAQNELTANSL